MKTSSPRIRYTLEQDLAERLKNPIFRKEWEDAETEFRFACAMIETRLKQGFSQQELAQKVKTSQSAISRIENMEANPSLNLMKRIAQALDAKLVIQLEMK